jgi:cytochrome c-type biogenesis protein CcmE
MDELTRDDHDEAGSGDAEPILADTVHAGTGRAASGATAGVATDLSPRVGRAAGRGRRTPWAWLALVAIVVALLVVVFNGLGDATLFFRNADEAVSQRDSLGDRRFRIQGRVESDSIVPTSTGVDFVIVHEGVAVTVSHQGDPPDLFQENIPVVLEGRWAEVGDPDVAAPSDGVPVDDGWFFASDRFFVKHEEVYVEENPDRTDDYSETGTGSEGDPEGDTEGAPTS